MAGNGVHQWRHNWIPLTPAAALIKAKGSKTTAAKLRQKHGVKTTSTRDHGPRQSPPGAKTRYVRPGAKADSTPLEAGRAAGGKPMSAEDVRRSALASGAGVKGHRATLEGAATGKPYEVRVRAVNAVDPNREPTHDGKPAVARVVFDFVNPDGSAARDDVGMKRQGERLLYPGDKLVVKADKRDPEPIVLDDDPGSHPVGATVDARQPGIDKVTRGKVVGHTDHGMLKVEYTDRNGKTVVGTFNPSHTEVVRPKSQGDLLREADARRTKPLDLTTKRQTELAEKGGPGLARDVSRGSRVTLPDGRTVTAFDITVDRDKGTVTIFPSQKDIDAGAPRQITVPDGSRVTVAPKTSTNELDAARARKAAREGGRAAELRDRAAAERAKLQGIADGAGVGRLGITDPQANRLSGRGLAQAHRNTDSSLRRYTETQKRANALEGKAIRAEGRAKEAGRTRLTHADVVGATHIVDQHGQPREVVRVNAKTVTVKTPYSWTETVPIEKIRRAIKATPEQIAEARRRAALRKP